MEPLGDSVSKSTSGATVLLLLFPVIFVISVAELCTRIVFLNFLPKFFELIRIFAYFTDGSFCELVSYTKNQWEAKFEANFS